MCVCWQNMFEATLKDREHSFRVAPGTSMFIHWLVGMVYIFYFASFILLLREVLRPGVLWFLRNLNDPDFNPIQEVRQLPHVSGLYAVIVLNIDWDYCISWSLMPGFITLAMTVKCWLGWLYTDSCWVTSPGCNDLNWYSIWTFG